MSKRMFSVNIVESDVFLDMPLTSQALYMHLNMNADNDGFVNPKRIMRMIGAANDDLQILVAKRFLLVFDSGVVVIKHWWINNTVRHDRHVPTTYQNELLELYQKDNKSYTRNTTQLALLTDVDKQDASLMATKRQPLVPPMQYNAAQYNPIQSNEKADKPLDFKKSKTLNKKTYAKALQADKQLAAKEQLAVDREVGPGKAQAMAVADAIKQRRLLKK